MKSNSCHYNNYNNNNEYIKHLNTNTNRSDHQSTQKIHLYIVYVIPLRIFKYFVFK